MTEQRRVRSAMTQARRFAYWCEAHDSPMAAMRAHAGADKLAERLATLEGRVGKPGGVGDAA